MNDKISVENLEVEGSEVVFNDEESSNELSAYKEKVMRFETTIQKN